MCLQVDLQRFKSFDDDILYTCGMVRLKSAPNVPTLARVPEHQRLLEYWLRSIFQDWVGVGDVLAADEKAPVLRTSGVNNRSYDRPFWDFCLAMGQKDANPTGVLRRRRLVVVGSMFPTLPNLFLGYPC